MIFDLLLKNAKLFSNGQILEGCIIIEEGKVKKLKKSDKMVKAEEIVDVNGKLVIPGVVDVHVHFRDPGYTNKEDFYTGSCAAAAGGVTTILDMPNTKPPTNKIDALMEKLRLARSKSIVDFSFHLGVPKNMNDLKDLIEYGFPSVKIFTYVYPDSIPILREIFSVCSKYENSVVFIHAENSRIIERNRKKFGKSRFHSIFYHAMLRSAKAEEVEIRNVVKLMREFPNVRVHFAHVSTKEGVEIITEAKKDGLKVTAEVTPHHLFFELPTFAYLGPYIKCNPPIRNKLNRIELKKGFISGLIDIIASDHAPHTLEEKEEGWLDIEKAPSGIAGVETMLPLILNMVNNGELTLNRVVDALCRLPPQIFGIEGKGKLEEGFDADLVILDLKEEWTIRGDMLHGKNNFTPFEGIKVRGKVLTTFLRGEVIYSNGDIISKPGFGKLVKRVS
ncbi:MAG: dihydroorotase [Candidatus Asgardarchaeia archaeon]